MEDVCPAKDAVCGLEVDWFHTCPQRRVASDKLARLKTVPALPPDLPGRLRQMAEDVEAGRVTAMAVGYVCDGS